jgi:hypothetical protein
MAIILGLEFKKKWYPYQFIFTEYTFISIVSLIPYFMNVFVQVHELVRAQDSAFAIVDSRSKYHLSRAKIASKIVKYPQLEDYKKGTFLI